MKFTSYVLTQVWGTRVANAGLLAIEAVQNVVENETKAV